jgi:RNase adapter protein RapZ
MRIIVLTGMSGSGKSTALRVLEDLGYYAIDNLPPALFEHLVDLFGAGGGTKLQKLALVVDSRALKFASDQSELDNTPLTLERIRKKGHDVELIFLEASDACISRRYSETRRRHPLSEGGSVRAGIDAERVLLEPLRRVATAAIDSSGLSVHDLKRTIQDRFLNKASDLDLAIRVLSFGFRKGVPADADLVFDVRFLPNPHFEEHLRPRTGEYEDVASFVLERPETKSFLEHLYSMLGFLIPQYEREGKAYLTIAIGCTGGRHRSVAVARTVGAWLLTLPKRVEVIHRDIPSKRAPSEIP